MTDARVLRDETIEGLRVLPDGATGIDAGLTLTKVVRQGAAGVEVRIAAPGDGDVTARGERVGLTGARAARCEIPGAVRCNEIDAAARGVSALLAQSGPVPDAFLLALLGTGTATAAVRDGVVQHMGGTALGGGSFAGIARRVTRAIAPGMPYAELIERAARGDRRRVDVMVLDAYPEGIGRLSRDDMTAAHLAKDGGEIDDVLASLLNLHGENIAQIAASRALTAKLQQIVLAGGFVHGNDALVTSFRGMASLFGMRVEVPPHAGLAGAIGAALIAHEGGG